MVNDEGQDKVGDGEGDKENNSKIPDIDRSLNEPEG
jgi:hypothetical protein